MDAKKFFVNLPQQLFEQLKQTTHHLPQVWQKLHSRDYSWTQAGLDQVHNLLFNCAKSSKQVQEQLAQLSSSATAESVPIFKNQTFLKLLANKMKLSPQTVAKISSLLDRFDRTDSPFSATTLLVLVLFIALGSQVPLIIKGSFSTKKAVLSVITILDYVLTAIDLAKWFKDHNLK